MGTELYYGQDREYFLSDISFVLLSGESPTDGEALFQSSGICGSSRRGNCLGSLLRHWYDLAFSGAEGKVRPQAIEDARKNAELNGITNAEFYVGKAEEVLPEYYARYEQEQGEKAHADVIVVDPPRKGCDQALLDTIVKMQPERIVYVSCDSATLARDLRYLCDRGYELKKVCGADMFPQGVHVETVCLLGKRKPDTTVKIGIDMEDYRRIRDEEKAK